MEAQQHMHKATCDPAACPAPHSPTPSCEQVTTGMKGELGLDEGTATWRAALVTNKLEAQVMQFHEANSVRTK